MTKLIMALALAGLIGCYELAVRMSSSTNHGIRVSIWIVGFGCVAVLANRQEAGLALLLAGVGSFLWFDRRFGDTRPGGRRT